MRRILIPALAIAGMLLIAACSDLSGPQYVAQASGPDFEVAGLSLVPGYDHCIGALQEMAALPTAFIQQTAELEQLALRTLEACTK